MKIKNNKNIIILFSKNYTTTKIIKENNYSENFTTDSELEFYHNVYLFSNPPFATSSTIFYANLMHPTPTTRSSMLLFTYKHTHFFHFHLNSLLFPLTSVGEPQSIYHLSSFAFKIVLS